MHHGARRARRRCLALVVLLLASGVTVRAQPGGQASEPTDFAEPSAAGGFRQFPGGREIPSLRAGLTARLAAAALRADADRQLPKGFRLREDGDPVVAPVGSNRVFRFGFEYDGVPVASTADYVAIVGRDGRLLASRFRNIPRSVDATIATVSPATAVAAATAHARGTLGQVGRLSATRPRLELWVGERQQGRLTWSITLREKSGGSLRAATRYRVAAIETPVVRSWTDLIRYESMIHVQADVWDLSPNQPTVVAPLSGAPVVVNGAQAGVTDVDGNLTVPTIAPGGLMSASLRGPLARVTNGAGPLLTASAAATGGGDETVHFAETTEFALAQTTGFAWANRANRWARQFLPFLDTTPTPLDAIDVFVNENIPCNAFSAIDSIHFGRATASCNNMATPTVILHEFGHSLHAVLATENFDAGYSEGFGDALALLVTEHRCMGPGMFRGSEACMRDATDVTTWPVTSTDPHEIGRPFAQFVWALAGAVGFDRAAELVLGAAVAAPSDVPDAVRLSFVANDDDGLLGTCAPDQEVLEAAADSRLLPRPPDCRPAGDNQPPTAGDDAFSFVEDEGEREIDLLGNDNDPDGDALEVSQVQAGVLGTLDCSLLPCTYRPKPDANGTETLAYTVIDTYGGQATGTVHIQIASVEDTLAVSGHGDVSGPEEAPIPVFVHVVDPDGPSFTMRWFAGTAESPAPCTFTDPLASSTELTCTHEGAFPFGVVVTQGGSTLVETLGTAMIANTHPSVVITAPAAGSSFPEESPVEVAASFDEGPTPGPHTCEITWGDGTTTAGIVEGGTCTGSHAYAPGSAGLRQIVVNVLDPGLARGFAFVFVQITSPGSTPCVPRPGQRCTVAGAGTVRGLGRVAFEFKARMRRARSIGHMLLLGRGWRFTTTAIRSLTIAGQEGAFSGTGSLNGQSGHTFEAVISDNRLPQAPDGTPDTMHVVIRDGTGAVVRVVEGGILRGDILVDGTR